jgi:hypothetical protein
MISTGALIDIFDYGVPIVVGAFLFKSRYSGMPKPPKKNTPPEQEDDEPVGQEKK